MCKEVSCSPRALWGRGKGEGGFPKTVVVLRGGISSPQVRRKPNNHVAEDAIRPVHCPRRQGNARKNSFQGDHH